MRRADNYPLLPDEIVATKDHIAAAFAALDGRFDKRIDELRALLKEVDAKARIVGSAEDAQKTRDAADQYLADQKVVVNALMADVDAERADVKAREDALAAREDAVRAGETELNNARAEQNGKVAEANRNLADANAALQAREATLSMREGDVQRQATAAAQREQDLNSKIERLRAASSGL